MRFRKRDRLAPPPTSSQSAEAAEVVGRVIEFDDLVKGTVVKRRGKPIRQYNLYVNGIIKLVTSGDTVDQATYQALVKAGAVLPPQAAEPNRQSAPEPEDT